MYTEHYSKIQFPFTTKSMLNMVNSSNEYKTYYSSYKKSKGSLFVLDNCNDYSSIAKIRLEPEYNFKEVRQFLRHAKYQKFEDLSKVEISMLSKLSVQSMYDLKMTMMYSFSSLKVLYINGENMDFRFIKDGFKTLLPKVYLQVYFIYTNLSKSDLELVINYSYN